MEDTLRGQNYNSMDELFAGLNPCFNGRYSQSVFALAGSVLAYGLNPCFNGRYSQSRSIQNDRYVFRRS